MYNLITQQFIRSRAVVMTLALILVMGVVSIFIGKQFLAKAEHNIARVTQQQREHIERNLQNKQDNIGLLLYYVRFALINKPDKLTALSIGQRDVNPGIQSLTIRNLEAQKYDTDLNNPANQLSGNLDLGFVIIYLFPLVIIALTFNLLSEEIEGGTWKMVAVQSRSTLRFLLQKMSMRGAVVYTTLLGLFVLAVFVLSLPLNQSLYAFVALGICYLAFWFFLSFWIVSFQKSSSFNALLLLSAWVILAIILPAAVNSYVSNRYPVPESLSTLIKQRDSYHQQWDVDKKVTMGKFYAHYPQFRKYTLPNGEFHYAWYYAMQQMGDDESRQDSKAMQVKIQQREETSRILSTAIPTMHAQLMFNDLAGTGLKNHLQFLDQTSSFHEKMRLHFYPKIFEGASVKSVDWKNLQPEYARIPPQVDWVGMLIPILVTSIVLSMLAIFNLRKSSAIR